MRRPLLATALVVAALTTTAQQASTASNQVPVSTAVHRSITVTGAQHVSMGYTITAGRITAVSPRIRGTSLLTRSVTARFGSGSPVVCTAGLLSVLNVLTGLGEATYTCAGFLESADRPRPLLVAVS